MRGFAKPSITSNFCTDIYDRWNGQGTYAPLAQMGKNMEAGMVLAMSAWYAEEKYVNGRPQGSQTGMSWLDGVNDWGKLIKVFPRISATHVPIEMFIRTLSQIVTGGAVRSGHHRHGGSLPRHFL